MWYVGEIGIGRTERGKRVIVMQLDLDRGERLEGKEGGKDPIFPLGGRVEGDVGLPLV